MIQDITLRVLPQVAASDKSLVLYIAKEKGIDARTIKAARITRRSIDARQRTIYINLTVRVFINEEASQALFQSITYPHVGNKPRVIVVGAGPGGLFAALRLIELGLRPIVLERGKDVHERRKDIALISREHKVNSESNYSFGEGGAGAFSDGKLYTRSKKRGNSEKILSVFCQHGASTSILSDVHPHIGTDLLPGVIESMRNTILTCGGEVHFETRVDHFIIENKRLEGVTTANGKTFHGPVILATGHSARDVYRQLHSDGIELDIKGLAVGCRLEHPSSLVDSLMYHHREGKGDYLPTAEYNFVSQVEGRGVYSFCMCPGGFVVPAASGPQQIVVNGMSPSNRGSKWSNSGMVVELHPEDLDEPSISTFMQEAMQDETFASAHEDYADTQNPLRMMYFQEALERQCWVQGNRRQTAPAQRMTDFVNRRLSYDLPVSSYSPGLVSSPLHFWIPLFITSRLKEGFLNFERSKHGFLTAEAVLIGIETRTSSPIRITRNNETLQHCSTEGLFPCGEGAGYAGGIVSAAIDGERCAEAVANWLNK
ncbi:MAG: FAD-binding protein [Bacteroidaceae bacterium]